MVPLPPHPRLLRRARTAATALAAAAVLTAGLALPAVPARAATGVDTGRLEFGVTSAPDELGWMTGSGVPWRYRYQYLAGGVNTAGNWETWQDPALPPGQFAVDYVNASAAAGYVPVLTWYELLQSSPSTGADEASRDLGNLAGASTMASYYASFTLLMQRIAATGHTAIVHVEPDLWGYLQQHSTGGNASSIPAAVASSGNADAAGYPNTAAGFAQALVHIRDRYAPDVLLGLHASMWASGVDVASDTRSSVNPLAAADSTAAFLQSLGMPGWNLLFHDVDDHDAGWWEAQGADNQWFTHWWDPANQRFPNFARWLRWVGELHARTALPQVMWQVPVGNQRYLTMNNGCGHYQDNVAEYTLDHPGDLYAAGVVAVLFGAGNACQTSFTDAQGDGVTNNGGVPTTDAQGWCTACNLLPSTVSDDDGGYLRTAVGAYYRGAPPLPPPAPAPPPPAGAPGYRVVASDGGIFSFGAAPFYGSTGAMRLNQPIAGMATIPDRGGYWLVASDGGIFSFGDARFFGSTGAMHLNQAIVGMAATPSGGGYWLVARDGGIFSFGDANFYGSTGGMRLNQPIVGMAATPSGGGYWLVASDGGIFAFGDARFLGSTGAMRLNRPITGMSATPSGGGYRLVASDGGIFCFGDARFLGSTGALRLNQPITGMASTPGGGGYWLVASDGGIFAFGDAPFLGSLGAHPLNRPVVGIGR